MRLKTKYSESLKNKIFNEYSKGTSIRTLSEKYNIDRRRISEFLNKIKDSSNDFDSNNEQTSIEVEVSSNSKKEGNEALISTTTSADYSVEEILIKNGYSPDEWEVTQIYKNSWEDSKEIIHHQTKLNLVKKSVNIKLQIPSPIKVTVRPNIYRNVNKDNNLKCAVIIPDMQCGFRRDINNGSMNPIHDREAIDVALQITQYLNPDRIVFLGDNLDLAEMSLKYSVTPDSFFTTQAALVELSWWLSKFRSINNETIIDYLEGNHENRLSRLINEKALSLFGLKSVNNLKGSALLAVENLLSLNDLNIEYHTYPSGKVALNSNLVCIHGETAKGQSGATVMELVKSARVSVIQGHIHRHEVATKTTWDAYNNFHMYTAASFGCLCKLDPGVVPGMKHLQNWQQGIGVVWYEEHGLEQFRTEFIPIISGRAIYTNEIFEARSEDEISNNIENEMNFKVT